MNIVSDLKYSFHFNKGVSMTPVMPAFLCGDEEAHRFIIDCSRSNDADPLDLSGAGVSAYFIREDGATIPMNGETNGSQVYVLLPAACYAVTGRFSLIIKLTLGNSISTIFWGEGAVSRCRTDVFIDPDSLVPSLEALLAQIDAMEKATAAANEAASSVESFKTDITDKVNRLSSNVSSMKGSVSDIIGITKNLLPVDYYHGDERWANGVTFVKQEDGTILATGTATAAARYDWIYETPLDPGTYVISGIPEGAEGPAANYGLIVTVSGKNHYFAQTGTFEVAEGDTVTIRAQYPPGNTANHVWAIMLEEGTTAHDYIPPGETSGGMMNTVNSNTQRIEKLETDKADKVEPLPGYWREYLTAKAPAIQAERMAIGNHGDYFSFFTDYHTPWSAGYTADILAYLKEKCHIRKHIFGGDIINVTTNAEAKELMQLFADKLAGIGLLPALGNHEVELYDTDTNPTESEVYALLFKHLEERTNVTLEPDLYYVYDNEPQKIRYIVLNTHNAAYRNFIADSEQINWLYQKMIELDEGWHIVVVMHLYYGGVYEDTGEHSTSPDGALVRDMMDALNNRSTYSYGSTYAFDFANAKATAIALLSGHTHRDHAETSATGFPLIATNCDAVNGSGQNLERAKGNPTEHAIDLFFIDTAARTIKSVRIGAGSDRTFTY